MDAILAKAIDVLEFGTVFRIENGTVVEVPNKHAPEVYHDPDSDVEIHGDGWECFTGMTGQDSYNGAMMHPSEYVGGAIARRLAEYSEECEENGGSVVFAIVVVYDMDDSEPCGWAIAYRETVN